MLQNTMRTKLSLIENSGKQLLANSIADAFFVEPLFDAMPDLVFFVKDMQGRYVVVNQTLVTRCGFKDKEQLIGRTADEVFPASLAETYREQDELVLHKG